MSTLLFQHFFFFLNCLHTVQNTGEFNMYGLWHRFYGNPPPLWFFSIWIVFVFGWQKLSKWHWSSLIFPTVDTDKHTHTHTHILLLIPPLALCHNGVAGIIALSSDFMKAWAISCSGVFPKENPTTNTHWCILGNLSIPWYCKKALL